MNADACRTTYEKSQPGTGMILLEVLTWLLDCRVYSLAVGVKRAKMFSSTTAFKSSKGRAFCGGHMELSRPFDRLLDKWNGKLG